MPDWNIFYCFEYENLSIRNQCRICSFCLKKGWFINTAYLTSNIFTYANSTNNIVGLIIMFKYSQFQILDKHYTWRSWIILSQIQVTAQCNIYFIYMRHFEMEHHWKKKNLAKCRLEPTSPVSVNRHSML